MTVSAVTPSVLYQGDGLTTVFPFAFPMDETSSLEVVFVDRVTHQITPVSPSDYTTTITSVGGTVTFLVAPATTDNVNIARTTDTTQLVSVAAQAAYNPQVVEAVWDKLTMLVQEALTKVAGTVPVPPGLDRETFYNDLLAAYLEAAAARDKAQEWAEGTGEPGGPGTKSSKSWSEVSEDWAESPTEPGGPGSASAKTWSDKANQWAENPEDAPVEPGEFSALHWATKAEQWAGSVGNPVSYNPNQGLTPTQQQDARDNIGLGTAATKDHGTGPGEVPLNSDLETKFVKTDDKATQAQAEEGDDNSKWMTPLRVKEALAPTLAASLDFSTQESMVFINGLDNDPVGGCYTFVFEFVAASSSTRVALCVAFSEDDGDTYRTSLVPISVEKNWSGGVSGTLTMRQVFGDIFSANTGSPFSGDQFIFPEVNVALGGVAVLTSEVNCIAFSFVDSGTNQQVDMAAGSLVAVKRKRT